MATLVTIEEINETMRLDLEETGSPPVFTDPRLPDVQIKLDQAEALIIDYLKTTLEDLTAGSPPPTVHPNIRTAIIVAFRALYEEQDSVLAGLANSDVTNPIVALLMRLRDPALA